MTSEILSFQASFFLKNESPLSNVKVFPKRGRGGLVGGGGSSASCPALDAPLLQALGRPGAAGAHCSCCATWGSGRGTGAVCVRSCIGGHSGARPEFILAVFPAQGLLGEWPWPQQSRCTPLGGRFWKGPRWGPDWSCCRWAFCSRPCRGFSGLGLGDRARCGPSAVTLVFSVRQRASEGVLQPPHLPEAFPAHPGLYPMAGGRGLPLASR